MKLNENPFERIKNGTKTVEFRLYDEKRQQIKIGDKIEFSKLPDLQKKLLVDVIELYREDTFKKLFLKLYNDESKATEKANGMYEIYSPDKEKQYGVLGIKIKINVDSLKENIEKFTPYNEQEEVEKKVMLKYIDDFDDVLTRQNEYGHFTSSSFILNKDDPRDINEINELYYEVGILKDEISNHTTIYRLNAFNMDSSEVKAVNSFNLWKEPLQISISNLLKIDYFEAINNTVFIFE